MEWGNRIKHFSKRVSEGSSKVGKSIWNTSVEIGKAFWDATEDIRKELFKLNVEYKNFKYNWIGYAIEKEEYRDLFYDYTRNGIETVEEKLKNKYSTNDAFDDIEDRFSQVDILNHRLSALSEAFEAHTQEKYFSSICLLYPQIEGIIWDIGVSKGFVKKGYNEKTKLDVNGDPVLGKDGKPVRYDIRQLLEDFKKNHTWFRLVKEGFNDILEAYNLKITEAHLIPISIYQFNKFLDKLLTDMRNPSLHGRNLSLYSDRLTEDFFNELHSVEAILVLESLYGLINDKSFNNKDKKPLDDNTSLKGITDN